jgi:hypothetical protein
MLKRTNREYGGELAFDAFRGQAALPRPQRRTDYRPWTSTLTVKRRVAIPILARPKRLAQLTASPCCLRKSGETRRKRRSRRNPTASAT